MQLSSELLRAFYQVAKSRSFSKAANILGLSQPALSIRIKKLEENLKTSLFLRKSSEITLTEVGQKLFLHCQFLGDFEKEFLSEINLDAKSSTPLAGLVRIAGYSTIVQSVLIPSLTFIVDNYPEIQLEVLTFELGQLDGSLKRSEAEFVITTESLESGHIESQLIGHESNVVIESPRISQSKKNVYLDNDVDDQATYEFFEAQGGKTPKFKRWYLDNAQNIVTAVEQGWGRAVHPLHIIQGNKKLRIAPEFNIFYNPVYLNYHKQHFYSRLHLLIREHLTKEFKKRLPRN